MCQSEYTHEIYFHIVSIYIISFFIRSVYSYQEKTNYIRPLQQRSALVAIGMQITKKKVEEL
jgi:hypothetical protein